MNKEVRWNKNMKKTRVQKSRDTVPLKGQCHEMCLKLDIYLNCVGIVV